MTEFDDLDSWWSTRRQLRTRDFDAFGHVTAARYAELYQEAAADFVVEAWEDQDASYVVARLEITYLREITRDGSPVRLFVRPSRIGRSGFGLSMVLATVDGVVRSRAEVAFAAWDRGGRCARPMSAAERSRLAELGGVPHP